MKRGSRVLVISHEMVDTRMAGPGIRYFELARVLARSSQLTLAVPAVVDRGQVEGPEPIEAGGSPAPGRNLDWWPYQRSRWESLLPVATQVDVIVACGDTLADFPQMATLGVPLVIDGYDPHTLETLALWAGEPIDVQASRHDERLRVLQRQCQAGDFFICASERQRDWWMGMLEQHGRVNPLTYTDDPSLRRLIDVVPFGLPQEPPQASRAVLRDMWPGIGPEDPIVVWGGGLWQWLDPLTAVRAAHRLAAKGQPLRLVFPGTRHPNPAVPDMPIRAQTMALADELGLTGQHVFFGDWIPYQDWPAVLLEADVGLSLHPDTAETRMAFRSRVLDYIWSGLPMVVTRGDAISDVVEAHGLGAVVDYGDDAGVADAIQAVLERPRAAWQDQFTQARAERTWELAAQPLIEFCRQPYRAADRLSNVRAQLEDTQTTLQEKVVQRDVEIARLRALVDGYEQGRLMRLMRQTELWRKRVGLS